MLPEIMATMSADLKIIYDAFTSGIDISVYTDVINRNISLFENLLAANEGQGFPQKHPKVMELGYMFYEWARMI